MNFPVNDKGQKNNLIKTIPDYHKFYKWTIFTPEKPFWQRDYVFSVGIFFSTVQYEGKCFISKALYVWEYMWEESN